MIDSRILRASHDDIGFRDYASASLGAKVISEFTSPTPAILPAAQSHVCNVKPCMVYDGQRTPQTALARGTELGNCWPFDGGYGHIGISLSSKIVITHVTIDHIPHILSFDINIAPKDMILWAVVEDPMDRTAYRALLKAQGRSAALPQPSLSRKYEDSSWMMISNMTYNITQNMNVQTFRVEDELVMLGIRVSWVILEVNSNWGNPSITCLYRVRVHSELGIDGS